MMIGAEAETELRRGLRARTVAELIDEAARRAPDDLAAVFPDERLTFGALHARSEQIARALIGLGVDPGESVAVLLPNSATMAATLLAIAKVGAVSVPINFRFKERERDTVVSDAGARVVIDEFFDAEAVEAELGEAEIARRAAEMVRRTAAIEPDRIATIMYTSGTTSRPKGCLLRHGSLIWQALRYGYGFELTSADRYWIPLPMFHVGGMVGLYSCLAAGAVFCHAGHFEPGAALEMLEAERCTAAAPVFETIWLPVLNHPRFRDADLSALRRVLNIGAPERLHYMQELFPTTIQLNGCGSTELCGQLGLSRLDDPPAVREVYSALMPGVEVRIVDAESGEDLPDGATGELLVRGPGPFVGYHDDPELTAAVIDEDGWVHTGDLSELDGDGRIRYGGRLKDMIKVGGENVAPAEVEDFLAAHRSIEIVSVVGVADRRYVEVPAAFVQLREGTEATERELIDFCVGRMATFKVPRYVRFVDDWPMSGTKIKKPELRARLEADLAEAGIDEAPRISSGREGRRN
jgi:fatty-acyl-CoA synthase